MPIEGVSSGWGKNGAKHFHIRVDLCVVAFLRIVLNG
ncbi:Uncharacterised protein [Yersinia aldovae]|nr:Uncharacterised protein [Yersinia aldovae]